MTSSITPKEVEINGFKSSFYSLFCPPLKNCLRARLAVSLGLGLLGWSAEVLGAWLVIERLSGAEIGLMAAAFIFSFSMLVGGLPLFPGGVGGFEGTMIALLLLLGVDIDAAVAATAVIRLATLGFALLLGFTALPFAIRRSAGSHPATVSLPGYGRP